jgi:hypothetical protein
MEPEVMLFFPCIIDKHGKIRNRIGRAMPRGQAEALLQMYYPSLWWRCEAIPQPVDHPYLKKGASWK